ncbi:tumor susceptibility protein 101 protein-like [Solea senegalensis]|uniref:Tumor susceptibility protein 101 protein-like n=2 Tax=Solea senegalensis TaxID=28829 RepID=A0AAV6SV62_SOLSE|nr:tumor susceptibility gene 101 protein [Solea senegalensis]KAG7521538.1 tumor susceptibility protein 101 protein-like [Solea senegalensis]
MSYYEDTIEKMLPKTYLRKHVAHEVFVVMAHFRALVPTMDKYMYNDGTAKNLMSLTGTLPVVFKDQTYHMPICLWLEESYPQTAPICYVRPTRQMMIVRGKHVSSSGRVHLPYLDEWKNDKCDLVSLLQVMAVMFGDFPPLCMRPHSEPEQASCRLQFHRQVEVLSRTDGSFYMSLTREDGQPFQQNNETNC